MELFHPLLYDRGRADNEDGATRFRLNMHLRGPAVRIEIVAVADFVALDAVMQRCQERDNLHRLAEAHLVCKDAADCLLMQLKQPRDPGALVRVELIPQYVRNNKTRYVLVC